MRGAWVAAACLLVACAPAVRAAPVSVVPAGDVVPVALAADDAARAAFASASPGSLDSVFADPALSGLRRQVAVLAARGLRREEEVDSRHPVHVSVSGVTAEVVIEVRGRTRLLTATQQPAYVSVLRQTRAHLVRRAGGWRVDGWADLRPDEWWRGGDS